MIQQWPAARRSALTAGELFRVVKRPFLLIQLLAVVTAQSDLWIAGFFCPHDESALYGAARCLMLLVVMPQQIANMTVLATIAELHVQGRRGELEHVLRRTASIAAIPSLSARSLLIVCGGTMLRRCSAPSTHRPPCRWRFSAPVMCLVAVGCCGGALDMTGHQNGSLLVNLAAALTFAVAGPLATAWFGLIGLSFASAGVVACRAWRCGGWPESGSAFGRTRCRVSGGGPRSWPRPRLSAISTSRGRISAARTVWQFTVPGNTSSPNGAGEIDISACDENPANQHPFRP